MIDTTLKSLKGYKTIPAVFRYGRRFSYPDLSMAVCFRPCKKVLIKRNHPDSEMTYLAVTISKKTARRAVTRNRIRRLLRESVRLCLKDFSPDKPFPIHLFVFSWRSAPSRPGQIHLADVQPLVGKLIGEALDYYYTVFAKKQYSYSPGSKTEAMKKENN